jgi:hypothetical protein
MTTHYVSIDTHTKQISDPHKITTNSLIRDKKIGFAERVNLRYSNNRYTYEPFSRTANQKFLFVAADNLRKPVILHSYDSDATLQSLYAAFSHYMQLKYKTICAVTSALGGNAIVYDTNDTTTDKLCGKIEAIKNLAELTKVTKWPLLETTSVAQNSVNRQYIVDYLKRKGVEFIHEATEVVDAFVLKRCDLGRYKMRKKLGNGQYGAVYITEKDNNAHYITKVQEDCEAFIKELSTYQQLLGTHMTPKLMASSICFSAIQKRGDFFALVNNGKKLSPQYLMVMEKMDGNFSSYMKKNMAMPDFVHKTIATIFFFLLVLRHFKLVHTDIKPGNIMYRDSANKELVDEMCLIDFGIIVQQNAQKKYTWTYIEKQEPSTTDLEPDFAHFLEFQNWAYILFLLFPLTQDHSVISEIEQFTEGEIDSERYESITKAPSLFRLWTALHRHFNQIDIRDYLSTDRLEVYMAICNKNRLTAAPAVWNFVYPVKWTLSAFTKLCSTSW